jgi:hypothetical protein
MTVTFSNRRLEQSLRPESVPTNVHLGSDVTAHVRHHVTIDICAARSEAHPHGVSYHNEMPTI